MRSNTHEFYDQLHSDRLEYGASEYKVDVLVSTKMFSDWLKTHLGDKIDSIDIGCGKGVFFRDVLKALNDQAGLVPGRSLGMDIVKSSGNVFEQVPAGFEFIQQNLDGEALPCDDDSFDLVFCNHVLEHVFETENLLREIRRVLRPEGMALVSVPNIAAWMNRLLFLFASQPLGTELGTESSSYGFWPKMGQKRLDRFSPAGHIRSFTPRGLQDLCVACGFETLGWWNQNAARRPVFMTWLSRNMGIFLSPAEKSSVN